MKITTLSAVLCLVATTALADKKATLHGNDLSIAASVADKRDARHHEINGSMVVKRADGPKGVNRHENQKKGSGHKDHGVEAHSDGGSRYHDKKDGEGKEEKGGDDNDDEEEDEEKKEKKGGSGKGDEKNAGDKKGGDGGDKKGDDGGDKKGGDGGDKKGGDG
ncbi:hypothetical protein BGZ95_001776, partial [Linnemannia exigua]